MNPPGVRGPRFVETVRLGLWFGLLTGTLEATGRLVQREVLGHRIWLSADVVWMAPTADVTLFLLAALILGGLVRLLPGRMSRDHVAAAFLFLLLAGPLLVQGKLHPVSSLLVAAGAAVVLSRALAARQRRLHAVARSSTAWLLLAVALATAGVRGGAWLRERRAVSALSARPQDAPNVILLILDTVRAKSLGLYGYERPTSPNLDRVATEGTVFSHAISTSPWTLPSHGSIFTGHYEHDLSADLFTPLDDAYPTLAERFAERGYVTAGFVANLIYATREAGLSRGFIHYEDFPVSAPMVLNSSLLAREMALRLRRAVGDYQRLVRKKAARVSADFLRWLDHRPDRPFFVFLNYFDAHAPYLPPDSLAGVFGPRRTRHPMGDPSEREHWSGADVAAERAAYDGSVAYLDQELGRLLRGLRQRRLLAHTLVVITADHGEQLGEHGLMDHGNSLYRPLVEVPLVMLWPGRVPSGLRIDVPVSLRDLAATLEDLALGDSGRTFPGRSLAALWEEGPAAEVSVPLSEARDEGETHAWMPLSRGDMKSIVSGRWHYILNGDGQEEVYDLYEDPNEERDLVASGTADPMLARLRATLSSLLDGTGTKKADARAGAGRARR